MAVDKEMLALGQLSRTCGELIEKAAEIDGKDGGEALLQAYAQVSQLERRMSERLNAYVSGGTTHVLLAISAQLIVAGITGHEKTDDPSLRCLAGPGKCPLRFPAKSSSQSVLDEMVALRGHLADLAQRLIGRIEGQHGVSVEELFTRTYGQQQGHKLGCEVGDGALEFGADWGVQVGHVLLMHDDPDHVCEVEEAATARGLDWAREIPLYPVEAYGIIKRTQDVCVSIHQAGNTAKMGLA